MGGGNAAEDLLAPGGFAGQRADLPPKRDFCEMTDIFPRTRGLPVTVRTSARGGAHLDARVKVCRVPGNRMTPGETAVVSVRPEPRLIEGDLDGDALRAVQRWIALNQDALIALRNGEIDGVELAQRLRRL